MSRKDFIVSLACRLHAAKLEGYWAHTGMCNAPTANGSVDEAETLAKILNERGHLIFEDDEQTR